MVFFAAGASGEVLVPHFHLLCPFFMQKLF